MYISDIRRPYQLAPLATKSSGALHVNPAQQEEEQLAVM